VPLLPRPALPTTALPKPLAPDRSLAASERLATPTATSAPLQPRTPLPQAAALAETRVPGAPALAPLAPFTPAAAPSPDPTLAEPAPLSSPVAPGAQPTAPALGQAPGDVPGLATARPVPGPAAAAPVPSAGPLPDVRPALTAPLPSGLGRGAADAGTQQGRDVATPPSAAASMPRLNLDLPRSRGGALSSQGSPGVLQLMARPPEVKSKLATDIEKAGKADCTKAYAGAGILAPIPLAIDALKTDGGCKW